MQNNQKKISAMRAVSLLSFVAIGVALGVSGNSHALPIMPNATLPDGSPGFNLLGAETSLPAVQLPAVQFLVGFNAVHPPNPNAPTLDLTRPPNPNINNPDTGSAFSIYWGMIDPGPINLPAIQFTGLTDPATGGLYPPSPCSSDPASFCFDFGATDGTNTFDIAFTITGATALDTASWGMANPGPTQLPAVQFNFDFMNTTLLAAGDPTFAFSVTENGNPLSFSVPEPSSILLIGSGIIGLFATRKIRISAASAQA
jgi:hypothetical protein